MSGRVTESGGPPTIPAIAGKHVYIGVGEEDPNLLAACQARETYARQGASVTFEVYRGTGHEIPALEVSPLLGSWFRRIGYYESASGDDLERLRNKFHERYKTANGNETPAMQFEALCAILDDPLLPLCGASVVTGIRARANALATDPLVRAEIRAEQQFRSLIWTYCTMRRLADFRAVNDGLGMLATKLPETFYGGLVKRILPPIADAYAKSAEASQKAHVQAEAQHEATPPKKRTVAPTFPASNHRSTRVPTRNGNRVTFEPVGK
jgi:hypothetical protein